MLLWSAVWADYWAPGAQVCCYEDSKLLKLFQDIVRILYDNDVIAEDTVMWCAAQEVNSSEESRAPI